MSGQRISNETLGKVLVHKIEEMKTFLFEFKKEGKIQFEVEKSEKARSLEELREQISVLNSFSVDLGPFHKEMESYHDKIKETSKTVKEDLSSPLLLWKYFLIYFGSFFICIGLCLFFNWQKDNKIEKLEEEKSSYLNYLHSDPSRFKDFQKWQQGK